MIKNNKIDKLEKIFKYNDYGKIYNLGKSSVEVEIINGYIKINELYFRMNNDITRAKSIVVIQRIK